MEDANKSKKRSNKLTVDKIESHKRLLEIKEKMNESVTRMSRSVKCDVRCAASSCPRHRHGVQHRPTDLASMLRFSRELLLKPPDENSDLRNPEENLGIGDGNDDIRISEMNLDRDPFEMLQKAMNDLKPDAVEQKYDAENHKKPFPHFTATVIEEEESIYSELGTSEDNEKQEEYKPQTWRCMSNIGVQTEAVQPLVTRIKTASSIKTSNSVIIPVNSNMQLSITVVPMQVGPAASRTIISCNSAGDSTKQKATEIFTHMDMRNQKQHEMTLHFIKDGTSLNSEGKQTQKYCSDIEKIAEQPGEISPISVSETLINVNNQNDNVDNKSDDDTISMQSKISNHKKNHYLEYPMSDSATLKIPPINAGGSDRTSGNFGDGSSVFEPKYLAQSMYYREHNLQRCVRTMSQVRRQFQREFAPLHDELSYIQNRVRCIFRYTGGIDVTNKIPEEVKRSAILSTIFRRPEAFGEPEPKRSWPDHIRKYPSCSVCTSFSAMAMQRNEKSCNTIWKKNSMHRKPVVVQQFHAKPSNTRSNAVKQFMGCTKHSKPAALPPRPIVSVTLDGMSYSSRHTIPRPITPYKENSTRKEAFFSSTISYFLDNRTRQREATKHSRRYNTEKVCSWRTPHSKRDFTLHTNRHNLDDSSSISTLSVCPSDQTISLDSVICRQEADGSVVYE